MSTTARRGHHWLKWAATALIVILAAAGIAVAVLMRRAEPMLRGLIVERLQDAFHARVELDSFHISIANGIWAEGKGLRIWPSAHAAVETAPAANGPDKPLIDLADFRFHAPLQYKPGSPIRIAKVQLEGLAIDVPARPQAVESGIKPRNEQGPHFEVLPNPPLNPGGSVAGDIGPINGPLLHFEIGSIDCSNAKLTMETSKPGKLPLEFDIRHLLLTHVSTTEAMDFDAQLINPKPKGTVLAKGKFGPWVVEDPGATSVEGTYKFENADLGTFKGIGGILNSTGSYSGALRQLQVEGDASVPKFFLSSFGTPLPLNTHFHALVDGTNGDTWLQPVEATLGRSHFTTQGNVVRVPGSGHQITLSVNVDRGRMEDFLRLASHTGNAMLSGDVKARANVDLEPGPEKVEKRIRIKGQFALDDAVFASANVQQKVGELSLRGQGKPEELKSASAADVHSTMQSDFTMASGVVSLPDLVYTVPGVEIDLAGTYGVADGKLAFNGNAKLQATVSQIVGGWMGVLLKPADRLFKKDGAGTEVSIQVDGTREDPQFTVGAIGLKKTFAERPGKQ